MVPTAQHFDYKKVLGVDVDVYHTTSSASGGKSPVIIFLHGGRFVLGNKSAMPRYLEEVARREWILVSANYRLAPQTPLREIYKDVVDVVAQIPPVVVETPFEINPATGGPYFQKSASHPRYQLFAFANKNGCSLQMMTGLDPNSEAEISKFKDISPLNQIHANYPPTYLVHGDADTMVIPEHSLNMKKALENADRKVRLEIKSHVFDFDIRYGSEEYQAYLAPMFGFLELEFNLVK
ncbi:hypothetical protein K7432_013541 [Basidiobolus ranarum]|uniref:Alpha/beta hydrolase fold-3 domain-containing protein n=1 Tax=Basidiobolus ranarum TaxID=34480 RepID=A0ABR2VQN9_9FUNG